ncbi:MAG: tetratricopeptide repeat protein [Desulfonatronovibrio sp.]
MKKIIFFLALLLFSAGCAVKHGPVPAAVEWDLESDAKMTYYYLRAQDSLAEEKYSEAAALLKSALERSPAPFLYVETAKAFWQTRDAEMSISTMEKAVGEFPDNPLMYVFLAELYISADMKDKAVEMLEDYRKKCPEDINAYHDLASFYLELKEYPQVLDILSDVPDERKTPQMFYYMGQASSAMGDQKNALSFLSRAVEKRPDFFQAWAEMAFIYEQDGDYLQAGQIYEKLLDLGETNPDLILRLIELNLKLNNPDKALDFVIRGPVDYQFRLDAAYQFIQNKFYSHAFEIIEEVMDRGAYPPTVYFYMALIAYEGWNDPDTAREFLENVPVEDYYHLQALSFNVQICFEQNEYPRALELARQGQDLYPEERRFVHFEVIILEILGDYTEAMEVIDYGLQIWPGDTDFLFRKGVILDNQDRREESLQVMEEIISIDQDHHEALNYVGYTLTEKDRDLERAQVLIQRALSLDPGNGYYIDSLAWVYFQQEKMDKAWKEVQRAVGFVSNDPIIWDHYGDIALEINMIDEALQGYQNSLKNEPEDPDRILRKIRDVEKKIQERSDS